MDVRDYTLQPNTELQGGRYRVLRTLGCGGFGITYLAEQVLAERKVCIKEFFPKEYYNRDEDSRSISLGSQGSAEVMGRYKDKFIKEAKTIARLDHSSIIHIHDVFEENNTCYYVMEYIEGESLSDIVKRRGALTEADSVRYIREAASALEYIHERKINHLDVKPGNIMVRRDDNRAILIDFGLSKHYDNAGEQTSSTPVGISHGFAPIEQYKQGGVSSFSPTTDIYALGATLYYLVTGSVPPSATDVGEEGLPTLPKHLSSSLCKAIEVSMSYWRKDRPQTIKAFVALLDGGAPKRAVVDNSTVISAAASDDEKTKIVPPQPTPQPKIERPKPKTQIELAPKPNRSRWWVWLLGLLLIGGCAWFIFGDNKEESANDKYADMIAQGLGRDGEYRIGDYYNRNGKQGVVFEVTTADGCHGKIVSLNEAELPWCTEEQEGKGIALGLTDERDGKVNTDKVMQRSDSDQYPAFVWCCNKGADWYLPAKDELVAIFNNQSAINSTLAEYNAEQIEGWYWSSTEYEDGPEFCAWLVIMGYGRTLSRNLNFSFYVRAVSAF